MHCRTRCRTASTQRWLRQLLTRLRHPLPASGERENKRLASTPQHCRGFAVKAANRQHPRMAGWQQIDLAGADISLDGGWLSKREAEALFAALHAAIPWETHRIRLF